MESHGELGPPGEYNHIYSYQTADSFCIAIQLRPPYEGGGATRQLHKIVSDWDSRKGVDDLTPNDLMIKFTDRSLEVSKRGGSSAWNMIRGLHGATKQQLNRERCYWTMTKHGGRYWLVSIELAKRTPGKLWDHLMRDEREANRPSMKWDKDMQKTPMIADKAGNFLPSTYCHPHLLPSYEAEEEADNFEDVIIEEVDTLEDEPKPTSSVRARDLVGQDFGVDETTQSMIVSMQLDPAAWRELQRDHGSDGAKAAFEMEIPFGGNHLSFRLRCDPDSPILRGCLGGCVWRKGCKFYVEQRGGMPVLELFMPKQTPEPWSFVVEGYASLSRSALDPYQQRILDGLWDAVAIEDREKGDEHFRESEYRAAVKCYSRALERNPDSYVTLTNRAAARLAFETEKFKVEEILEDARRALEINPQWHKAKFREGVALCKLRRFDEAIWALEAGQRMDSSGHAGWEEEIWRVKEERTQWSNRKKLSYLNDVE